MYVTGANTYTYIYIYCVCVCVCGPGSSVGIASHYGLDNPGSNPRDTTISDTHHMQKLFPPAARQSSHSATPARTPPADGVPP